ncbi:hypothetical protein DFR33_101112 [Bradymonas sediminis]|nr:hypothetical protein DFR33_101112 [Bradymonas sediminis]
MSRRLHLMSGFRFAKALLLTSLLAAALSLSACSDNDECVGSACDPEPVDCTSNIDCELGTYCGPDFVCIEDPCDENTCERGTCTRGSTVCQSKASCEEETADVDCVFGDICQLGTCMNEQTFCEALNCKRGVCNYDEQKCVAAENCDGDSDLCMEGSFCNDMGQCAPDLCVVNEVECADGGVCVPSLGECANPDTCSSNNDCLDNHICVLESGSLGSCLLKDAACGDGPGDGGCYGNKTCEYDPISQLVACQEQSTCETALDCNDGRECISRQCQPATACVPDAFEPNNTEAEATDFLAEASDYRLAATMCAADSDYFLVDALSLSNGLTEGALLIDVQYEQRDIGLGGVELEVFDPAGESLAVENSGQFGVNGSVAALVRLSTIASGNYLVRVSAADDVAEAGINYTMSASFSTVETQEACMNAIPLVPGSAPVSGNTSSGASTAMGSLCAGTDNPAPEVIYSFEIEERSAVSIYVIPNSSSTKLTASIRRACALDSSEVACQADVSNMSDSLSPLLEPGIYYLIVQGLNGSSGGGFKVSMGIGGVVCTPASNACIDENTASICSDAGTVLEEVSCAAGCDPETKDCRRVEGDLCSQAIEKSEPFTATINWADYRPDISLSASSSACVPAHEGQNNTGGAEAVWAVTIPPGKVLDATLTLPSGEFGSMYIMNSCIDPSLSCEIGANRGNVSTERIGYANDTAADETVYLVADSSSFVTMTSATLDVQFNDVACDPAEKSRCDLDGNIEKCNPWGTQYDVITDCNFGCTDSPTGGNASCSGPTNNTCSQPFALTSGVPVSGNFSDYSHDNKPASSCSSSTANGPEAVYVITTTVPNTKVHAEVVTSKDAVIYSSQSCAIGDPAEQTCVASSDIPEWIEFMAPTPGDYYIFVDTWSSITTDGDFTVTATLTEPSCVPGESLSCASNTTLEVCDSEGFPTVQPCRADCLNGECVIETGDTCEDPLVLTPGTTVTGDTGQFYPDYTLSSNSCTGKSTRGNDMVYQIETTQPGQIIDVELVQSSFNAALYVTQECVSTGGEPSCLIGQDLGASENEHLTFVAHDAGVYFVHVGASSVSASGTFEMKADVRTPTCTPGETLGCAGDELEFCGPLGEVVNYACSSTCTAGACDAPSGDVCQEPVVVFHGETVGGSVNDTGSTNSLELNSGKNNQCLNGTSKTIGKENIYRIDLLAGELLTIEMDGEKSSLVSYISESCVAAAQKCQSVDSNGKDGLLQYYAQADGSVFLVVDASDSLKVDYQFTVDISSGKACEPGAYRCVDADTLEVCSEDGSSVLATYICAEGCSAGTCLKAAGGNTCDNATNIGGVEPPNVGAGISVEGNFAELNNSVSVPANGCTRAEGKGSDLIYKVDLGVNDVLEATVYSPSGEAPMAYILTDCADTDSCLAGGRAQDGLNTKQKAYTRYMSDSVQTVYVVADSANSNASGRFRLDIAVSPAQCTPGVTSCVDGQNEEFCDQGRLNEQFCMYGSCSGGGCTGVAPDTCADAQIVPNDGQVHTYRGLIEDLNDSIDLGEQLYECIDLGPSPGFDAVYAIDLNAGEFLDVKVDSPADTIIWVSESCGAGMENACSGGVDEAGKGGKESLLFDVRYAGTYYIIVDTANADVYEGEYTIDVQVRSNECTFGAEECVDGFTKRRCNRDRLWEETECYYGCDAGACMDVIGDTCDDAILVPDDRQPHTFRGRMEDYSAQSDIAAGESSCTNVGTISNGPEVFYAVDMNAGDIVEVAWTSTEGGQLWIATSCDDLLGTCGMWVDEHPSYSSENTETMVYRAEQDGTYYIVGDNYYGDTDPGEFEMQIHVRAPDCDDATSVEVCIDAETIQVCNNGVFVEQSCNCQGDRCVSGCDMAVDVTGQATSAAGATFTGNFGINESEHAEYCGQSAFDTSGDEFYYSVDLQANETVTVTATADGITYPVITFLDSCSDIALDRCLQPPANDESSSVTSSYTAAGAETVIIMIDNDYPSAGHGFTFDIKIN